MPAARAGGGGRGREGSDGGVGWALGSFAVGLIGDTPSSSLETSLNTDIQGLYVTIHPFRFAEGRSMSNFVDAG